MKTLLVLGALIAATYGGVNIYMPPETNSDVDPYFMEDVINSTIEAIRPDIPDPLNIDYLNITFPPELSDVLKGAVEISNLELTGLRGFQLPALTLALIGLQLNFTLVFPSINLHTTYWGDLVFADLIPLYGDGNANVHIEGLEIQGSGQANIVDGISVENLRVQLYVGSVTFDIHGALNDEDFSAIISQILTDLITPLLDNHQEAISNILSPLIEGIINAILSGADPTETPVPPAYK